MRFASNDARRGGIGRSAICDTAWTVQRHGIAFWQQFVNVTQLRGIILRRKVRRNISAVLNQDLHAEPAMRISGHFLPVDDRHPARRLGADRVCGPPIGPALLFAHDTGLTILTPVYCMTDAIASPITAGFSATVTPAAVRISTFSLALSPKAEMIAPAWPMVRPLGAVRPAT